MADKKTTVSVDTDANENGAPAEPQEAAGDDAPPEAEAAQAAETPQADAAETAELRSRMLHVLADMENLRRRTEREIADTRKYAIANFAREMLTVGDNLRRALDAVPPGLRDGDDEAAKALIEGVEVTARSLEQALEKAGVTRIEAKGQKFDPSFHQAMMEVDAPEAEPGSVAEEIQVGYAIGERVLRPAFVSVVKKRPKADGHAPAPAAAATADDDAGEAKDAPAD